MENTWRGDCDSDAESIDSEQEDPLKYVDMSLLYILFYSFHGILHASISGLLICRHAGIYTAEEVALMTRDKLIRLQSLYIDQFKRLQHLMKEKRRLYLHRQKQEKDSIGMIPDPFAQIFNLD